MLGSINISGALKLSCGRHRSKIARCNDVAVVITRVKIREILHSRVMIDTTDYVPRDRVFGKTKNFVSQALGLSCSYF